ncbi:MAG TPA: glycoside hydrolase family 28 protein [Acidobacteriaceae bacterium]|jgi:polygalacturonase
MSERPLLTDRRTLLKRAAQFGVAASLTQGIRIQAESSAPKTTAAPTKPTLQLNVRDFGAVADGTAKDTTAIQQTIDRCSVFGGGEVLVPAGTYLTGGLALRSGVTLRLEKDAVLQGSADMADYPVTQVRWEGRWIQGHIGFIHAINAANVGIVGEGKISGADSLGGRPTKDLPLRHPALIEFVGCQGIHLEGFSTSYNRMWSIHPSNSDNIVIRNLTIRSTGGNGDGIDIDSCKHVLIEGCDISTGDDCISLKSGRGEEGYTLLRTTEDITIRNCTFADSIFACIGIGSETSGGIRNVRVSHCKFTAAKTHAIYIKSRPGRGAFVEDLDMEDLEASNMHLGFLRINQLNSGIQDEYAVPGMDGIPTFRNFRFRNVRVHDAPVLVQATEIHPDKPLDGLLLSDIEGTCAKGITLVNTTHAELKNIHVTGFEGPLLSTYNVTGKGLQGSTTIAAPAKPAAVPEPATPYKLH